MIWNFWGTKLYYEHHMLFAYVIYIIYCRKGKLFFSKALIFHLIETETILFTIYIKGQPKPWLHVKTRPLIHCDFFSWELFFLQDWNNHYEAWNYMKKKHKKIKACRKSIKKKPTVKRCLLILDLKPIRLWLFDL